MAETETVLLKRFTGSGDAEAFAEIIRRHAGLVYGAALRILADVDQASDVAQETFLQLARDAGRVTGSLSGWLHRVATHKAIDQKRREVSRRHRERRYATDEGRSRELTEWKDISSHVDVGLREIDPELREILILHFLEARTTREIAALRGASQATISRRIGAGVEQLRARLRQRGIIVAIGTLSVLLGDNAVQAAPLSLLTELGKMAMVGAAAGGVAGTGSGLQTITTGVLTAVKTKVAVIAAVVVLGTGSVVTYHTLTKPASESATTVPAMSSTNPQGDLVGLLDNGPEAETQWDVPPDAGWNWVNSANGETWHQEFVITSVFGEQARSRAAAKYGGMMGNLMGAFDPPQMSTPEFPVRQTDDFYHRRQETDWGGADLSQDPNCRDPNGPIKPESRFSTKGGLQ